MPAPATAVPAPAPAVPAPAARPAAAPAVSPAAAGLVLTLKQAVDLARRKNLTLRASRMSVQSADLARKLSWGLLGPHVSFGMDFTFIGGDSSFSSEAMGGGMTMDANAVVAMCQQSSDPDNCLAWMLGNGEYVGLMLGQVLSGFGKLGDIMNADTVKLKLGFYWQALNWSNLLTVKRTGVVQRLARESVRDTTQDVTTSVGTAFYGLLAAQEAVSILRETAKASVEHLRQARALMAAGQGTIVDILRWQAKMADDDQKILAAEQGVASARIQLNNLLGRPLQASVTLVPPAEISGENLPAPTQVEAPVRTHPKLRLVKLNLETKRIDVQGAKASFLPTVDLSAGYTWQHYLPYEDAVKSVGWMGSWAVMLSLKVPIFDSMIKLYDVRLKELELRKAELEARNVHRLITQGVLMANLEVLNAYKKIEVARTQVKLMEEAVRSANNLYQAGNATTTDVIDQENTLQLARFSLLSARYSYLLALVQRARATGEVP
jgi:outer membrane protein TolC